MVSLMTDEAGVAGKERLQSFLSERDSFVSVVRELLRPEVAEAVATPGLSEVQ
jgi:hypothetical protein